MPRIILTLALLIISFSAYAQISNQPPTIYRGTVIQQIHGCEIDGTCNVEVKIDDTGKVFQFIYVAGDGETCRIRNDVEEAASKLKPGDHVEIQVQQGAKIYQNLITLCGEQTKVILGN